MGRENGGGQPEREGAEHAAQDRGDHGVEATPFIRHIPRCPAAETGTRVENRDELVGEGGAHGSRGEGVAGEVRDGDEEAPLEKVRPDRHERESGLPENGEVRQDGAAGAGREAGFDEEVGEGEEEDEDVALDADGAGPAQDGEEGLQG